MASILRSCKFVRFFAGFARNIAFGTGRKDVFDNPAITSNQNVYSGLAIRALATQTARHDTSLEQSLKRLDQDARRAGRISRRELDDVLEEIKQSRSATSSQSLMVIRCCGSLVPEEHPEVRTKLVQEIWNTLEALGVPMDISHYNALLRVYLENEHPFSPSEFLEELERKGVEPNRVTYQRLVARHCQQGDMEGAAKILQIMRDQQMPVNESVFNALVTGHAQSGDMESARGILGVMNQAGLEPGAETYTALLNGHAKRGDMEAVRAVLAECEAQKVELLDRDFLSIIHALATSGNAQYIDEILGHLKKLVGYNQDCVNLILRLVNAGQEDVGLQLLSTLVPSKVTEGSDPIPTGQFFIKQLVKSNRPITKVVSMCEDLQKRDMHPRALLVAMETALSLGLHDMSLALATAIKAQGQPIRQHYFWPLLAKHSKSKNSQGLCEVLRHMLSLGVVPLVDTLRDYAIPGLMGNPEQKVSQLRSAGVSAGAASSSLALSLLSNNNMKAAADIVNQVKANYGFNTFKRPIAQAFAATSDVASFLTLLQVVVNSNFKVAPAIDEEGENTAPVNDTSEMTGQIVLDCFKAMHTDKAPKIQSILEGLIECGQGLSASTAEQLQEKLGADLTPELSTLLSKLTSGVLVPTHVTPELTQLPAVEGRDLENLLKSTEARGLPTKNIRRQLLNHYCRIRDLEKAEEIKKGLDAEGFVFQPGSYAMLLDLYCHHEKLEDALAVRKLMVERDPEFQLDASKTIRLAGLLIKNEKIEEAVELLKSQQVREQQKEDRVMFGLRAQCWRMLNELAEKGRVEDIQKVFEALVGGGLVPINNVILGPLIKVHLTNNDLKAALDRFEWCCQQHHSTPWKNELACRLIQAEDAAALQKLTDLSTQVHGEVNSLYDLVLAFVECGRVRQARKILETPGLRSRPYRLSAACQRYSEEGQVASLEGLVEATKDLGHIDRENIYLHLLNTYCKTGDPDKALGLWTQAQEEDVQPSDEFLRTLGNFLTQQGRTVPFIIPELPKPEVKSKQVDETQQKQKQTKTTPSQKGVPLKPLPEAVSADLQALRQALRRQDVDKALELKETLESKNKILSVRDSSVLVESMVNAERVGLASKVVIEMLEKGLHPLPRVFRYLLNKLALAGDIDALNTIGKHLDDDKKKMVSFDNRLCNAHIVAGRAHEYLEGLEKALNAATTEEALTSLGASFPRGGALGILEKHPELEPKFASLAAKFAERGETSPTNVLWMQYFVRGEREAAQKLWDQHLLQQPRLMFQWVCQVSRRNADSQLAADLFSLLVSTPSTSPGARGNVLSCLLDVLTTQQKYDEGLAALTAAHKDVGLDYVNRTALHRLKSGLEEQGKTFPFTIPSKSASKASSSSSSSSDDEDEKKH